ncbi:hypothetical protein ACWX0K_07165 [Nitrobacteraceae bacterium UC4446_H13]
MAAQNADTFPIVLITLESDDLVTPLRLSSDPTVRFSIDPLRYGTRSRGEVFEYMLMSALLPDDKQDAQPAAQIVIDNVVPGMIEQVRAVQSIVEARFEIVFSNNPDFVEEAWERFRLTSASFDDQRITLSCGREPLTNEGWPAQHMSQSRFPGLFR